MDDQKINILEEIKVGQCWKRKNGSVVEVTNERVSSGMREVELTPLTGKGRVSWKWDRGVVSELLYVGMDRTLFLPNKSIE